MNFFIFYTISYFLTYLGFLLGKATTEEHKEIKNIVFIYIDILLIIFYLFMFYLIGFNLNLIIFIISFILFLLSFKFKILRTLNDVFLFTITFCYFYLNKIDYLFLVLLPMFFLVLQNSFKKFDVKEVIYEVLILILVFMSYTIF